MALASLASAGVLAACAENMTTKADVIDVRAPAAATNGVLRFKTTTIPCALGRSGIVSHKHEGDGGTPAGEFSLRAILYRPDRIARPETGGLPLRSIENSDGWCDDPRDPAYNHLVRLPYPASAEKMWRDDHLYDLLAVVGYNDAPTVPGLGSAIFMHVAKVGAAPLSYAPTQGCIAMRIEDLRVVLAMSTPATRVRVHLD